MWAGIAQHIAFILQEWQQNSLNNASGRHGLTSLKAIETWGTTKYDAMGRIYASYATIPRQIFLPKSTSHNWLFYFFEGRTFSHHWTLQKRHPFLQVALIQPHWRRDWWYGVNENLAKGTRDGIPTASIRFSTVRDDTPIATFTMICTALPIQFVEAIKTWCTDLGMFIWPLLIRYKH